MNSKNLFLKILSLTIISLFFHVICGAQNKGNENKTFKNKSVVTEGLDFVCSPIPQIYPGVNDFNNPENIGKILVSDWQEGGFHTDYQTENGKMQIKAIFEGDIEDGTQAYFKVLDPDDKSTYETDTEERDNKFPYLIRLNYMNVYPSDDDSTNDMISVPIINNEAIAVFEFSRQNSGDNYVIEVSLDSSFPIDITAQSIPYTTWKRIYVEYDRMYTKGSTLMMDFTSDENNDEDDRLFVENLDDFYDLLPGQLLTLFTKDGIITDNIKFVAVDNLTEPSAIFVEDFNVNYTIKKYTGILINGETEAYNIDVNILEEYTQKAYGNDTHGEINGGAFVEFNTFNHDGSGFAPKFGPFTATSLDLDHYMDHWQQNIPSALNDPIPNIQAFNVFYLLAGTGYLDVNNNARAGVAIEAFNRTLISVGVINSETFLTETEREIKKGETVVHEFGHLFSVYAVHVDSNDPVLGDVDNHHIIDNDTTNDDKCQMSYLTHPSNGISEYDLLNTIVTDGNGNEVEQMEGCLWVIRRAFDPR